MSWSLGDFHKVSVYYGIKPVNLAILVVKISDFGLRLYDARAVAGKREKLWREEKENSMAPEFSTYTRGWR